MISVCIKLSRSTALEQAALARVVGALHGEQALLEFEATAIAAELPAAGGFHTPASAMAEPLLARLEAHAGLTFTIEEH